MGIREKYMAIIESLKGLAIVIGFILGVLWGIFEIFK